MIVLESVTQVTVDYSVQEQQIQAKRIKELEAEGYYVIKLIKKFQKLIFIFISVEFYKVYFNLD